MATHDPADELRHSLPFTQADAKLRNKTVLGEELYRGLLRGCVFSLLWPDIREFTPFHPALCYISPLGSQSSRLFDLGKYLALSAPPLGPDQLEKVLLLFF